MHTTNHVRLDATVPEHFTAAPRPLNVPTGASGIRRIGFLLVPGFTYIGFTAAIEPLRMANMAAGKQHFEAVTMSAAGQAVTASNGVRTLPDQDMDAVTELDAVFVCGPNPMTFAQESRLCSWLRQLARRGVALGGIDTGSYLLARAGLLKGYRCTIHWQNLAQLKQHHPAIAISPHVFTIDRDRYTCTGGTAAMDLMLTLIAREPGGTDMAAAASTLLVQDRVRSGGDRQHVPEHVHGDHAHPGLHTAVTLMADNIEQPLALAELAARSRLSSRHLVRLFRDQLDCTPSEYYMRLRLKHARQLLLNGEQSIAEASQACGFANPSYFSRRYLALFGHSPSHERDGARPGQRRQGSALPADAAR